MQPYSLLVLLNSPFSPLTSVQGWLSVGSQIQPSPHHQPLSDTNDSASADSAVGSASQRQAATCCLAPREGAPALSMGQVALSDTQSHVSALLKSHEQKWEPKTTPTEGPLSLHRLNNLASFIAWLVGMENNQQCPRTQ